MARKFLFSSMAVVVTLAMVLAGCGGGGDGGDEIPYLNDGVFVYETIGDIYSFDPAWVYDTASGMQVGMVYEQLIYYDGSSTEDFQPLLATDTGTFNATDNTLRFTIREGVQFSNGNDLTPEDVEYTFERAMCQDRPGGPIWMFYQPLLGEDVWHYEHTTFAAITSAVEVDGDDVVFTLAGPYWETAFKQILCGQWACIVDKDYCIDNGDWDGTEGDVENFLHPENPGDIGHLYDNPMGTGPWTLNTWDQSNQIILDKNTNYWNGAVPFDNVITKVVDEWSSRKLSLLAGEADLVYVPASRFVEMEPEEPSLQVFQDLPSLSIDAFFMNFDIHNSTYVGSGALDGEGIPSDFFSDIDVRKAFCYAFDYDTYIADALNSQGVQRGSPVVEGLYGYWEDTPMYSYCLTEAVDHMQAAWGGEAWDKGFEFTLLYNAGNLPRKTACELVSEAWAKIGNDYAGDPERFQVNVQALAWPTILGKIFGTRDMPMFQIGWLPDYPHADNFLNPFMHSQGVFSHFQGYGNNVTDAALTAAFQETDYETQMGLYEDLQQQYYDDAPGIVLAQPIVRRYFTPYIDGFYYNPCESSYAGRLIDMSKSES